MKVFLNEDETEMTLESENEIEAEFVDKLKLMSPEEATKYFTNLILDYSKLIKSASSIKNLEDENEDRD